MLIVADEAPQGMLVIVGHRRRNDVVYNIPARWPRRSIAGALISRSNSLELADLLASREP